MKVKSESEAAQSCLTLSDPMDCRHQAPLWLFHCSAVEYPME